MRKLKLNFGIMAMILGVSAAVAFKPATAVAKPTTYTWYAVKSGSTFTWQSTRPSGACVAATGTCEISTTIAGTPANGGYPASYSVVLGADKNSAFSQ